MPVDHRVSLGRFLDLAISAGKPLCGVLDHPGSNHVQVDVHDTAVQMFVGADRRGVIAIFSERSMVLLALVVLLRRAAGD